MFRQVLFAAVSVLALGSVDAEAATADREAFSFDATLVSGALLCGEFVGLEEACPEKFGTYSGSQDEDLMQGAAIGETYSGRIVLKSVGDMLVSATCRLRGRDCLFSTEFVEPPYPLGPNATVDFTDTSITFSQFTFNGPTGQYLFGTDYIFDADGVHYYAGVKFDLSGVTHEVAAVPLPASAGLLLLSLAGLGAFFGLKRRGV